MINLWATGNVAQTAKTQIASKLHLLWKAILKIL